MLCHTSATITIRTSMASLKALRSYLSMLASRCSSAWNCSSGGHPRTGGGVNQQPTKTNNNRTNHIDPRTHQRMQDDVHTLLLRLLPLDPFLNLPPDGRVPHRPHRLLLPPRRRWLQLLQLRNPGGPDHERPPHARRGRGGSELGRVQQAPGQDRAAAHARGGGSGRHACVG